MTLQPCFLKIALAIQSLLYFHTNFRIILSSSLHGLILSDAYGIPNLWISVSNNIIGGDFKFLDYFSGVERHTNKPIKVEHNTRIEDLIEQTIKQYKPIVFNKDILLDACPFM